MLYRITLTTKDDERLVVIKKQLGRYATDVAVYHGFLATPVAIYDNHRDDLDMGKYEVTKQQFVRILKNASEQGILNKVPKKQETTQ